MQTLSQPHSGEKTLGLFSRTLCTGQLKRQHHVFKCCERREQLEILKDKAYFFAAQGGTLILIEVNDIDIIEVNIARSGRIESRQQP